MDTPTPAPLPYLLTPREAARALSISERTLWTLRARGDISAVTIGRAVRYPRIVIVRFIEHRLERQRAYRAGAGG